MIIVPPGGFAGFAQQTPATQAMFQRAGRTTSTTARRRKRKTAAKKRAKTTRARRRTTARAKRPARLVKGSRAAKAYMAKIRRKRRK